MNFAKSQQCRAVPGPEIEIESDWRGLLELPAAGTTIAEPMHHAIGEAWVLRNLLSTDECQRLIAEMEGHGFGTTNYPQAYRGNLRLQTTDCGLAEALWERMHNCVPTTVSLNGLTWYAVGLNEKFRLAKYRPGDRFCVHADSAFQRDHVKGKAPEWSCFTVNVYLNEDFKGGRTRFYDSGVRPGAVDPTDDHLLYALEPSTGAACVFRQPPGARLLHDGETVSEGYKYLLRTDVMYRLKLPCAD